jgi:hypothetical protein
MPKPNETPNLLELVQAHAASAGTSGDLSICGDEIQGLNISVERPICGDEATDDIPSRGPSLCADEISDIRLKTDIEQVGTTVYGLPLYHFRYKTGAERYQGVMAEDVLEVMPDAVVTGEDGYFRVRYDQLGIRMTKA